jgi:hypothetical protein
VRDCFIDHADTRSRRKSCTGESPVMPAYGCSTSRHCAHIPHFKGSQSGRCIPKDQQAFPLEQRGEPNADPPGPTA